MRIRDSDAPLNGDVEVRASQACRFNGGPSLDDVLRLHPHTRNAIRISREPFGEGR